MKCLQMTEAITLKSINVAEKPGQSRMNEMHGRNFGFVKEKNKGKYRSRPEAPIGTMCQS
jgi:hypothetical protein